MTGKLRSFFALCLMAALCIPVFSQAEWVQKEIQWKLSGVTGDGASIFVRDTIKAMLGGGTTTLDTTGVFTLKQAQPLQRGAQSQGIVNGSLVGATANDTTIIGYLIFQADSTAAPTASLTTMTIIVEGRAGGFGPITTMARGWVKADSIVVNGTAGNASMETIVAPLRTIAAVTGQNTINNLAAFEQLRARLISATGVLSSARAFVRYWRPTTTGTGIAD